MERIIRKQVEARFEILRETLGDNKLELSYIAAYGGYAISGLAGLPTRHTAREMFDMITFALRMIKLDRREKDGSFWPSSKQLNEVK